MDMFETLLSKVRSSTEDSDDGPHSCKYCQSIVVREDYDETLWKAENDWMNLTFDLSLERLREACAEQCLLCQAICEDEELPDVLPKGLVLAARFSSHMLNQGRPDQLGPFGLVDLESKALFHRFGNGFKPVIRAVPNDPAASRILTRPINDDPSTTQSWRLVREWLDECLQDHPECKARFTDFIPSRLLEICRSEQDHLQVQLKVGSDIHPASYTALSYCWGEDSSVLVTTIASLDAIKAGIPLDMLPRTIKDAVLVTHNLNMRYIWVDSLCIIQDSKGDKRREISKMPQIYGEATLVIAASRCADARTGFLQPRKRFSKTESQIPFRQFDNEIGSVVLHDTRRERAMATEPLDTRAWAMQERLLATRIIEYGTLQTRWTCLGNRQGYSDGWTEHEEFAWGRYNISDTRLFSAPDCTKDDLSLSELPVALDWYALLWHYTHRKLTINTDRLLAISGIVQEFAKASQEKYAAGLWEALLPDDLLWSIDINKRCLRPTEYQAPSWSWASVNGPMYPRVPDEIGRECCLQLIKVDVMPQEEDLPHGAVTSGCIVVRGRVKPAKWNPRPITGKSQLRQARNSTLDQTTTARIKLRPDDILPFKVLDDCIEDKDTCARWEPVTLLLGRCDDRPCPDGYSGLILKRVRGSAFTRVGKFIFKRPVSDTGEDDVWHKGEDSEPWATWFNDSEEQEVVLE